VTRPASHSASTGRPPATVAAPSTSPLFAKLLAIVVAVVATGSALLTIRHQRLETMHRIAETREAIDREIARQRTLDARIAELIHPDALRARLNTADVGPWVPRPERPVLDHTAPYAVRGPSAAEPESEPEPAAPRFAPWRALAEIADAP
jgi:hypothetical protein